MTKNELLEYLLEAKIRLIRLMNPSHTKPRQLL